MSEVINGVPRSLLEQVAIELEHDNDRYMLGRELRKLLATAQPAAEVIETDCRSEEGVTVGLIDALLAICRPLATRDLATPATCAALEDLRSDSDALAIFLGLPPAADVEREAQPIEVIGYASPGQVEILRKLPRTGGMKVNGRKNERYSEPVVLLSSAISAVMQAVIRCEQAGAFKTCMECGYQDGHDEICQYHESKRAAQPQQAVAVAVTDEVRRLREALGEAVEYLDSTPFNEIGAGSILHRTMRDALSAHKTGEEE